MTKIEQLRKQLSTGRISISDTEIETLVEFRKLLDLVELQHEALKLIEDGRLLASICKDR